MHDRNDIKAGIFANSLLDLARNGIAYDFFVSKILWGLSNYLIIGKIKQENFGTWPRKSMAAIQLRAACSAKGWRGQVTFEHCWPLNAMYEELVCRSSSLCIEEMLNVIGEYPAVIITKKENGYIKEASLERSGVPEIRYRKINLGFALKSTPDQSAITRILRVARENPIGAGYLRTERSPPETPARTPSSI